MSDFEQLVDRAVRHAKKTIHRQGELWPTWFVVTRTGDEIVERTLWEDPGQKYRMINTMRFFLHSIEARRFVMVCESWVVTTETNAEAEALIASGQSLETRSDRYEALSIVGEDQNGEACFAFLEMHRRGGRTVDYGPLVRGDDIVKTVYAGMIRTKATLQ